MTKVTPSEKPLLDKLGVKPGMRAAVIGIDDASFLEALGVRTDITLGEAPAGTDIVFLGAEEPADVERLAELRELIARDGAIWVVNPRAVKGRSAAAGAALTTGFNSNHVMRLGLEAGLVDVKIARFSDTHTATKFVIRRKDR